MPDCVTLKVLLPIVTVPVREVVPVFDATLSVTVPVATPADPDVTVTHCALLTAVHAHPAPPFTVTVTLPPALLND